MLTHKNGVYMLNKVEVRSNGDCTTTVYGCDIIVQLAGDSVHDCTLDSVRVTEIAVHDFVEYKMVNVTHEELEGSWKIYTDTGFEEAISKLLGEEVQWTEMGMQEDGFASMEC